MARSNSTILIQVLLQKDLVGARKNLLLYHRDRLRRDRGHLHLHGRLHVHRLPFCNC